MGLEVERGPVFSMLGGAELATGTDGDRVVDLFLRGGELAGILAGALRRGAWLDAYLSAAGLQQLVDDRAPASQAFLRRTARHLLKGSRPLVHAGGQALSRVDGVLTAASARTTGGSHLVALSEHLAVLLDELAPLVLGGAPSGAGLSQAAVSTRLAVLAADVEAVAPVLGGDVIRLPSCFHSFDQHPADMAALVRRFVERWPDRSIPVAVAGIRTSGGYLAPLCAAALRELGFEHAESLSLRPGSAMSGAVVERLRGVVGRGGLVLLVDDPPITGRSYREAIDQLARVSGVARSSVVVLLASFSEDEEPPAGLAGLASVVLPYSEWDIVRRLGMPSATDSLSGLLPPGARLSRVEAIAPALPPRRGHARALLAMDWQDGSGWHRRELVAEGTGLGFFGRQAVEVARRAPTLFPEILGLADGVLFRELLPEELSWAARPVVLADAEPVARHLADRHAALRRPDDPTVSFAGRQAAREVAAREIARTLGPLAEPLGPFLAGAAVRRILDTSVPTLIDGDVARENWFFAPGQPPRKASFAEGPFGHHDLASYDPVFDLAGTAVAARDLAFEDALRERYAGLTGLVAEPARWMLLELVHLWNERRLGRIDDATYRRGRSLGAVKLFASLYLGDLDPPTGPYCAFDLDGVLEGSAPGYPAMSEASALALRAVRAHGFRVLLASGRASGELQQRCALLGLDGAVSEYGAVAYDAVVGVSFGLLSEGARRASERLRKLALDSTELTVDHAYTEVVRCCHRDERGRCVAIGARLAEQLLEASGTAGELEAVHGVAQTDFVPREADKGRAIRSLLARDPASERLAKPLAFAIGDSGPDVPMLELAEHPFVPAHAAGLVLGAKATVTTRAYQAGTAQAVGAFLGHAPGTCPRCAAPVLGRDERVLVDLLSLHEAGKRAIPARLVGLGRDALAAQAARKRPGRAHDAGVAR